MSEVYIVGGLRTPIGVANGQFKTVRPEILAAHVLRALVKKYNCKAECLIAGNAVGTGGNIARLSALEADLPISLPSFTIDSQCTSALTSIDIASSYIRSKTYDCVIAGGFESASLAPIRRYAKLDERRKYRKATFKTAQFRPNEFCDDAMLIGAERTAKKVGITRKEADIIAVSSHKKAMQAKKVGVFCDFIVPIENINEDEGIRPRLNEKICARAPRITSSESGILTAANTCFMNDGAAFIILASENYVKENKCKVLGKMVDTYLGGFNPAYPPLAADGAASFLLKKNNLKYTDVDIFEYNEAFALITAAFTKNHSEVSNRINPYGGALAYGHPYGATGAMLVLHALRGLDLKKKKRAVVSIAAAGGLGQAVLLEKR